MCVSSVTPFPISNTIWKHVETRNSSNFISTYKGYYCVIIEDQKELYNITDWYTEANLIYDFKPPLINI